jgi:excinuclease ABC subunit B
VKEVRDLTDRVRSASETAEGRGRTPEKLPAAELSRLIRELEKQMKAAADELEFEKAAVLRDQVYELRAVLSEKEQADLPAWERERRMARMEIA